MSTTSPRTQAHHLPELADQLPLGTFDGGPFADEADYADVYATARLCDAMDAARAATPPQQPDPDGARLMAEYAAHQLESDLSRDPDFAALLDASREQFIDWLSTMGSDPHAPRPGVATVRPAAGEVAA